MLSHWVEHLPHKEQIFIKVILSLNFNVENHFWEREDEPWGLKRSQNLDAEQWCHTTTPGPLVMSSCVFTCAGDEHQEGSEQDRETPRPVPQLPQPRDRELGATWVMRPIIQNQWFNDYDDEYLTPQRLFRSSLILLHWFKVWPSPWVCLSKWKTEWCCSLLSGADEICMSRELFGEFNPYFSRNTGGQNDKS